MDFRHATVVMAMTSSTSTAATRPNGIGHPLALPRHSRQCPLQTILSSRSPVKACYQQRSPGLTETSTRPAARKLTISQELLGIETCSKCTQVFSFKDLQLLQQHLSSNHPPKTQKLVLNMFTVLRRACLGILTTYACPTFQIPLCVSHRCRSIASISPCPKCCCLMLKELLQIHHQLANAFFSSIISNKQDKHLVDC
jgi:hypothetical protein